MIDFRRQLQLQRNSGDPEFKRHIYVGNRVFGGEPLYLAPELLGLNGCVWGTPGTGKTSFLIRLFRQLAEFHTDTGAVWFDHKGSLKTLKEVIAICSEFGIKLKIFSYMPGMHSHLFEYFMQSNIRDQPAIFLAQQTTAAHNALYGTGYGPSAFSAFNLTVAQRVARMRSRFKTHRQVARVLRDPDLYARLARGTKEELRKAEHIISEIEIAGEIHPMNLTESMPGATQEMFAEAIDMPSLLSGPRQLYYFFLPAMPLPQLSGTCGRLPIFPLINAAANRKPHETNKVVVIHDEFHVAAAPNLLTPIEQAREHMCSWVFSYQYPGQLSDFRTSIDEAIEGCCSWTIAFDAPNYLARREMLMQMGTRKRLRSSVRVTGRPRERPRSLRDLDEIGETMDYGYAEESDQRIAENDLLRMAKDRSTGFFWTKTTAGLTRDILLAPFKWSHLRTPEERERIIKQPLPVLPGQLLVDPNPFPLPKSRKKKRVKTHVDEQPDDGEVTDALKNRRKKGGRP